MCAPRVTRHTSIRYSNFSHTRVNMGQHGHYIHSRRLAAEMWTTMKNNLLGRKFLSCSFHLYRCRKYVSYGFPIINFCNPVVHYETPCILRCKDLRTSKICILSLGDSPDVWILFSIDEDGTEWPETSAHTIQTPGNHPKEVIQHTVTWQLWHRH
jgi:hypothetical protein